MGVSAHLELLMAGRGSAAAQAMVPPQEMEYIIGVLYLIGPSRA